MKTKIITFFAIAFLANYVFASDAYLVNLSLNTYIKANTTYPVKVRILNNTTSAITYCDINWQLDNGIVNSQLVLIGGNGLMTGYYFDVTSTTQLNIVSAGSHKFKIWVSGAYNYDNNHSNDTIKKDIIVLSDYVNNKVLIEEITATSCQYCPPANTVINSIANNLNAVAAAFHLSDIYSFTNGTNYIQSLGIGGTPKALINLGEMGNYANNTQYDAWEAEVNSRIGISPVDLQFTPVYNATTRLLTINSSINFKYALTGDFYLNLYVLESGIIGTQTNATNPYTHNHVVRAMLGGINGINGFIPASPVVNSNYTHQDTITIPATWNAGKLEVLAYVFEKNTSNQKNVLNAAKYSYYVGIDDVNAKNDFAKIYPNPVTDEMFIKLNERKDIMISVYTIEGKLQIEQNFSNVENCIINTSHFTKGINFVKLNDKHNVQTLKVVKQ
ncbi:MAG: Omp28-related outer membrane protein [Bacteroidetes bacterium]|nr:Omp28-related outer membrane protein [Bacteroidota bacterium]